MFNFSGGSSAELPRTLACRPMNEPFNAAPSTVDPASIMVSSIRAPVILQSAPMEAYGPITELLMFALAWTYTGGTIFYTGFYLISYFGGAAMFEQIAVRLQGGGYRTGIQPHLHCLGAHFQAVLDHDVDGIRQEVFTFARFAALELFR